MGEDTRLLAGKTVMVTGGGRGIGAGIARELGAHGAVVAVNYRRDHESAESVVADIEKGGSRAIAVQGDAGDAKSAESMVRATIDAVGDCDGLVCSTAGPTETVRRRPALESMESVNAVIDRVSLHLRVTMNVSRLLLPGMRRRGGGSIVFIGAAGSRSGGAIGMAQIAAAKTAQDGLARVLVEELAPEGIRVNTVAPGTVFTDANDNDHHRTHVESESLPPTGRVSRPKDVAGAVLFMISDLSRQTAGAFLPVDGGKTML